MSKKKPPSISINIKKIRKAQKISQDKLSKLADVAYNTIVKIESGENGNPTINTLQKIASALNVKIDNLIGKANSIKKG